MTEIMQVMTAAKAIMRQSGNMHQWGEGNPSETVITADMEKHGGYVIEENGQVVAYFAFLPSPEPTYSTIHDGEWIEHFLRRQNPSTAPSTTANGLMTHSLIM